MTDIKQSDFDYDIVYEFCSEFKNRRAEGTITGYRWSARNFMEFLSRRGENVEDTDWKTLQEFITEISSDYSESTVKTRYNHLRTFFRFLRDYHGVFQDRDVLPTDNDRFEITDFITRGATEKSERTAARDGVVFVRPNEFDKLVRNVPAPKFRNEIILKMLYGLGLRRTELVDIRAKPKEPHRDRFGHINFSENRIQVQSAKSDSNRAVWFDDDIEIPLKRWITSEREAVYHAQDSPYLFPSRNSEQLTEKRVGYVVREAAENAGIQSKLYEDANGNDRNRITAHALRHGFAVQHVRNGTNIKVLKDLLGHEDISTTQIYLQFDDKTRRQAQRRNSPDLS